MRRIKERTSAVFLQSGLGEKWCADSTECYCYLRHIQDPLAYWETPYERRFGERFKGQVTPSGAMVDVHPISAKDESRLHQFGKKVLPGICLGHALVAGGGGVWKGGIIVEGSMQKKYQRLKRVRNSIPIRGWNRRIVWKRSRSPRILYLRWEQRVRSEDLRTKTSGKL